MGCEICGPRWNENIIIVKRDKDTKEVKNVIVRHKVDNFIKLFKAFSHFLPAILTNIEVMMLAKLGLCTKEAKVTDFIEAEKNKSILE